VRTPVNQSNSRSTDSDFSTTYTQFGGRGTAVTTVKSGSVDVTDPETGTVTTVTAGGAKAVTGTVPGLAAAVLPASRSVQVNVPATAFATLINTGNKAAVACQISPITAVTGAFSFQTTDPATNQLVGDHDTPVSIAAGSSQTFVIALTPSSPLPSTDVQLDFACGGTQAPVVVALDTLLLSASLDPVPDIVALAATPGSPLIVDLPGATGVGVFVVAAVNVGVAGTITVTADTGGATIPIGLSLCQTNPTTSACMAAPAGSVTTTINAGATPTFGIFVAGTGAVPFDPASNRIFVRFRDAGGVTRGATSVAVRTL